MRDFLIWCSKYVSISTIIIVGVLVYILFFQDFSVEKIYRNELTIDSLNRAIAIESDTLDFYLQKNRRLDNHDSEMVEKVVREQHNMSLPNEEIYIFK